jgi:hypothetical protein
MIWLLAFVALLVVSSGFRWLAFWLGLTGFATALLCALLVWIVGLDTAALALRRVAESAIAAFERASDRAYPERAARRAAAEQEQAACRELRGPDRRAVRRRGRSCADILAGRAEHATQEQYVQAAEATALPPAEPGLLTQAKYDRLRERLGTPGKGLSPEVLRRALVALRRFAAVYGSAGDVQLYSRLLVLLDSPDGSPATRVALVLQYCQQRGLPAIVFSGARDETASAPSPEATSPRAAGDRVRARALQLDRDRIRPEPRASRPLDRPLTQDEEEAARAFLLGVTVAQLRQGIFTPRDNEL